MSTLGIQTRLVVSALLPGIVAISFPSPALGNHFCQKYLHIIYERKYSKKNLLCRQSEMCYLSGVARLVSPARTRTLLAQHESNFSPVQNRL